MGDRFDNLDPEMLALLAADDPVRVAAEASLDARGREAVAAWAGETDALRSAARRVTAREGLKARLKALPGKVERPETVLRDRGWLRNIAAAAAIAVGLWGAHAGLTGYRQNANLEALETEVAAIKVGALPSALGDARALERALNAAPPRNMPVEAEVYAPQKGTTLLGGGTLELEGRPVYFARYAREGVTYTMYQLSIAHFDLPRSFAHRMVSPAPAMTVESWPDHGMPCGWFLVADSGKAVRAEALVELD